MWKEAIGECDTISVLTWRAWG